MLLVRTHLLSKGHVLEEQIDGLTLYVHFEIGVCMELEDAVLRLNQSLPVHPYTCACMRFGADF